MHQSMCSEKQKLFEKFIVKLNQRPLIWTLGLGVLAYASSFVFAVFVWALGIPIGFEIGFFLAATLVIAYHFVMSRYQTTSKLAQIIQLAFAYVLVALTTAMVGVTTFQKGYQSLADWIYG